MRLKYILTIGEFADVEFTNNEDRLYVHEASKTELDNHKRSCKRWIG